MGRPPRIQLQYRPASRLPQVLLAILVLLNTLLIGLALQQWQAQQQAATPIAQRPAPHTPQMRPVPEGFREQVEATQKVINQLGTPWGAVLHAISQAGNNKTTVDQMVLNTASRQVQLSGRSADQVSLLNLLQKLKQQSSLRQVTLRSHSQMATDQGINLLQFEIEVSW